MIEEIFTSISIAHLILIAIFLGIIASIVLYYILIKINKDAPNRIGRK